MHRAARVAAVVWIVACGARSNLDGASDGAAPDASADVVREPDVLDAPVLLPTRTCTTPSEWAIPIVGGEAANVDVGSNGLIVATVGGRPPQDNCHSGPTVGEGGCAVLLIEATSDIVLERRFACAENWNITRTAFATDDGGFVLSALVPKGADVGSGALGADALVVARYGHDGLPIYVHVLPSQGSAMSTSARPSGDAVVLFAKTPDELVIERLDSSGATTASRSLPVQMADNLEIRLALLDTGEIAVGATTFSAVDWGDGLPDVSQLVILDASLATTRIVHVHDFIQFASMKPIHGGGFAYSGSSSLCTLDLGGGPIGCGSGPQGAFAAGFVDSSTLGFVRKVGGGPVLNADVCVDATGAVGWLARADATCSVGGANVYGGFFAALTSNGDFAGAAQLPYDFAQAIGCDSASSRVIGGVLEHATNLGPATLPPGGFILRRDVSALLH